MKTILSIAIKYINYHMNSETQFLFPSTERNRGSDQSFCTHSMEHLINFNVSQ